MIRIVFFVEKIFDLIFWVLLRVCSEFEDRGEYFNRFQIIPRAYLLDVIIYDDIRHTRSLWGFVKLISCQIVQPKRISIYSEITKIYRQSISKFQNYYYESLKRMIIPKMRSVIIIIIIKSSNDIILITHFHNRGFLQRMSSFACEICLIFYL